MDEALLIIDFQNDFTSGGALEVPGGDDIAEPVKRLADRVDFVVATRDWHPPDHASFETEGGPWPVHCVRGTPGADFHPAMERVEIDAVVDVGREREDEGYSGFEKSELEDILREREVEKVYVCGLATDYCVRASAIDAADLGFETVVVEDAIRAVNVNPDDGAHAIEDIRQAGAELTSSEEILSSVRG
jgi:nicotinamidase/pyrazinamidase